MTHVSHTADGGGHGGAENYRGVALTHCPAVDRPVLARNRTIHGDVSVQVVCREAFYRISLIGRGGDKDVSAANKFTQSTRSVDMFGA